MSLRDLHSTALVQVPHSKRSRLGSAYRTTIHVWSVAEDTQDERTFSPFDTTSRCDLLVVLRSLTRGKRRKTRFSLVEIDQGVVLHPIGGRLTVAANHHKASIDADYPRAARVPLLNSVT